VKTSTILIGLQNSFFQFGFPEIRKLVIKIVKLKLLELHLAIAFTKFFIMSNLRLADPNRVTDSFCKILAILSTVSGLSCVIVRKQHMENRDNEYC